MKKKDPPYLMITARFVRHQKTIDMMHKPFAIITLILAALAHFVAAEVVPVWSTGVAVPGEQVILYLIDTEIGQDTFSLKGRPSARYASIQEQRPTLDANPMDPNRAMVEIYPILIRPDKAGQLQLENVVVEYRSGKTVQVKVPPLPVHSTAEIKWYTSPVPYGALWYTNAREGYVHQPVKVALKLFIPQDCHVGSTPQMHAVGVKIGTLQQSVQGVLAIMQSRLMDNPVAFAKGQNWRTADFTGEFTPFREGNSDVTGKVLLTRQRGFILIGQDEVPLPTLTLSALPLPPGAPAQFADTVGHYTLSSKSEATSLAMNEAVEVEITVRGNGNLQQIPCPAPDDAKDWKLVPATRKPIIGANGETVGMVFSQLMRPVTEVRGIPAFSMSYFDPTAMEYKRAVTAPIALPWRETDTAGAALVQAATPPPAGSIPVAEMTDIYGYMTGGEQGLLSGVRLYMPRWVWYLLYLPAALILGYMVAAACRRRLALKADVRARERELATLSRAEDGLSFLKGIGAFIESHIPRTAMTPELQEILQQRDNEAFRPDAAPEVPREKRQAMLRSVRKALASLAGKALLIALMLLPLVSAAEGTAEQQYNSRQYTKALDILQSEATDRPNPINLYNIGNCYYRLGQPGKAALYYARALLIDPALPEARANLAFIQRKEGAILPIRTEADTIFTLLTCSQLWVTSIICTALLALCIALLILRRRVQHKPWLTSATALFAVLSLLCAIDWVYYTTRETPDLTSLPPGDIAYVLKSATAHTAADDSASSVVQLPVSTPVHLLAQRGSWSYVETTTGVRGWVHTSDIEALSSDKPRLPISIHFYS